MNRKQIELGEENYIRVLVFMQTHLCATQRECSETLDLSVMAVNRHVKRIRQKWKGNQK